MLFNDFNRRGWHHFDYTDYWNFFLIDKIHEDIGKIFDRVSRFEYDHSYVNDNTKQYLFFFYEWPERKKDHSEENRKP